MTGSDEETALSGGARTALSGAMQDQACEWIARLRSETAGEADYEAFALWLAASPEHRAAMDAMLDMWGDLGAARYLPETSPQQITRRRWLTTGLALAASVCLAVPTIRAPRSRALTIRFRSRGGQSVAGFAPQTTTRPAFSISENMLINMPPMVT